MKLVDLEKVFRAAPFLVVSRDRVFLAARNAVFRRSGGPGRVAPLVIVDLLKAHAGFVRLVGSHEREVYLPQVVTWTV